MKSLPVLLAAFCLGAQAAETMVKTDHTAVTARPTHFVAPEALDLPALVPAPPAPDSLVTRTELEVVLQFQDARTPAQAARCVQIESEDIWLFGAEVVGPWFTAGNLPQTAAFFAEVRDDFILINRTAKALYPRRRPPFADPRIKPCVEFADTGAYPSGHGIQSSLWAALLGEIFPEHAAGFQARALETRRFKLISGVHYPSDIVAGQVLGEAVARAMLKNPAVQQALEKLRTEAAPHLRKKTL